MKRRLQFLLLVLWLGTLSCATLLGESPTPVVTTVPSIVVATPTLANIPIVTTPTNTPASLVIPTRRPTPTDTPTIAPTTVGSIPCPAGGNNLLVNPGFETDYRAQGNDATIVAQSWVAWWLRGSDTNQQPDFRQAVDVFQVHSGSSAQQLYKSRAQYQGGVYQIVENAAITPGTVLQFSAWGQGRSCAEGADCSQGVSIDPANMFMRVGIDPTGNLDAKAGSVLWSPYFNPIDQYMVQCVTATAQSSQVVVFTWSSPDKPRLNQDTYWDDGALVILP